MKLGVSHALEVLVLGLVVVVYKIQYSSCVFNTVGVLACHIYSWFLPMSWILDLSILLSTCRAYIYIYVRLVMPSYLFFVSTSMRGLSHAVQNAKKLWKFT